MVLIVVDFLELDRRDHPDLAVESTMIEPVDVLGRRELELVDALPGPAVADQLGLEQRVERLGQRIVIRIPGRAD